MTPSGLPLVNQGVAQHRPAYALALIQQGTTSTKPTQPEPRQAPLTEPPDDGAGQPLHEPEGRYLPAGCAGHVCGTIAVPLHKLEPKINVEIVIEADAVSADPVARIDDAATIATQTLAEALEGKTVRLQPVIDLPRLPEEDQYRPSVAMRRAVLARWRSEAFPYSTTRAQKLDLDHVQPWHPHSGPAQTRHSNLLPLTRTIHRAKTATVWILRIDEQGRAIWTSPLGYQYEVTPHGTQPLTPLRTHRRRGQPTPLPHEA